MTSDAPASATQRFSVNAGRLVAGTVERQLRQIAFEAGLDIQIQRHRGLLDVVLLVEVSGPEVTVRAFLKVIDRWIDGLSDEPGVSP